jgi:hypothetical protein
MLSQGGSKPENDRVAAPRGSILAPVLTAEEKKQLLPRHSSESSCTQCGSRAIMTCGACWTESRSGIEIIDPTTPIPGSATGSISPQLLARHTSSAKGDKLVSRHEATLTHVCSSECMSRAWLDGHHSHQHKWAHSPSPQPRSPPSSVCGLPRLVNTAPLITY